MTREAPIIFIYPALRSFSRTCTLAPDLAMWVTMWPKLSQPELSPSLHSVTTWEHLFHPETGKVIRVSVLATYGKALWASKTTKQWRQIFEAWGQSSSCSTTPLTFPGLATGVNKLPLLLPKLLLMSFCSSTRIFCNQNNSINSS